MIKGLPNTTADAPQMKKLAQQTKFKDANKNGKLDYDELPANAGGAALKHNYFRPKAGGEAEEAVVVPKGKLPLQGSIVGFWVDPKSELAKDPAIMNDPRRLDMVRPNQFVKAKQSQGVAEGVDPATYPARAREAHEKYLKYENMVDQELRKLGQRLPQSWDAARMHQKLSSDAKYALALKYYDLSEKFASLSIRYEELAKKRGVTETALKDKEDLAAKRRALQDLSRNPGVDQKAVQQRQSDLEKEAKSRDLAESLLDEFAEGLDGDRDKQGMAEGSVTKQPQPYNDPNWTKNLPKEKLDALAGRKPPGKKSQGVDEASGCNHTMEGEMCPEHGLAECGMHESQVAESQEGDALLARIKSLALLR
jgi:hypothetical protein